MDPARLAAVAQRHGIVLAVQFGSSVTGRLHAHSDVDVAVLLEHPPLSLDVELSAIADLQALVNEREVDVVFLHRADPLLLKQIAETGRRVYGSTRWFAELKIYAFKRYQDHRHYLAMEREYVSRRLQALAPTP